MRNLTAFQVFTPNRDSHTYGKIDFLIYNFLAVEESTEKLCVAGSFILLFMLGLFLEVGRIGFVTDRIKYRIRCFELYTFRISNQIIEHCCLIKSSCTKNGFRTHKMRLNGHKLHKQIYQNIALYITCK